MSDNENDLGQTPPGDLLRPRDPMPAQAWGSQLTQASMTDLLRKYPNGFVVTTSGYIYEVVAAGDSLPVLMRNHALPPAGGGYFVTRPAIERINKP